MEAGMWKTLHNDQTRVVDAKKKKNWDKVVSDCTETDDQDAGCDEFFANIFSQGSDEMKRAMNKSFVESGGKKESRARLPLEWNGSNGMENLSMNLDCDLTYLLIIWDSQAVTHPSTNQTRCCLTSGIGREPVFSAWYGSSHLPKKQDRYAQNMVLPVLSMVWQFSSFKKAGSRYGSCLYAQNMAV
uniref:SGS domain-containing protein n=1 Tax=Strigamia maritima TaxID=126957 RepID=T1IHY8_STRMM